MNTLGIALVWCIVQITLLGIAAGGFYLLVRRYRPAAASSVLSTGLALVAILSLLAISPWPCWTRSAATEASSKTIENSLASASTEKKSDSTLLPELGEIRAVKNLPKSQPTTATLFWQAIREELSRPQGAAPAETWRWPAILAVALVVSMILGLAWMLLGVVAVRRQRRRSRPLDDRALGELIDVLRAELGCLRPIEVRQADDLATAATIGWRRPTLLLPADWTTWNADQLRAVLAHEIAHARSHDFLTLLIGQFGLMMHGYHPLMHWLMNRLRLEQELAADAAAASVSGGQRQYLVTIAELALTQQDRPMSWPARTFLPTRTTFLRRITMLRDSKLRFDRLSPAARLGTISIVFACALLVAGLRGPNSNRASADEPTKPSAASDSRIDTTFFTDNAQAAVIFRPADLFSKPELKEWGAILEESNGPIPQGYRCSDIRQVTIIIPQSEIRPGPRDVVIVQFVKPVAEASLEKKHLDNLKPNQKYEGKKASVPPKGGHVVLLYDEFTVIEAGSKKAMDVYMASKRGVLPSWIPPKDWESYRNDQVLCMADSSALRNELKDPVNAPADVRMPFMLLSPFWQESDWLALGIYTKDRVEIHASAAAKDAETAAKLQRTFDAVKTLVENLVNTARKESKENAGMNPAIPIAEIMLDGLKSQTKENRLQAETSIEFAKLQALAPVVEASRKAARQSLSANNMKQIALAIHNYEFDHKNFPPAVLFDKKSKIPYSWRVALLPYFDEQALYDQYRFDEPWDGPNNIKLLDKMPRVYRNPTDASNSKNASYFVLTGPGTVFDGDKGTQIMEIIDGTSNTILAVEAKRDIPWTKPEDIPYDAEKPLPKLGGFFEGKFLAVFCDGAVHILHEKIDKKVLRLLITKDDKQMVEIPGVDR
jgi:beta-lactamase regulating signal transducer with metallopeptidase domain